jgi:hypothetical protein
MKLEDLKPGMIVKALKGYSDSYYKAGEILTIEKFDLSANTIKFKELQGCAFSPSWPQLRMPDGSLAFEPYIVETSKPEPVRNSFWESA